MEKQWKDASHIVQGRLIVGIDEAGRGCLAGPVYAAACVGSPTLLGAEAGIDDSKALSPKRREAAMQTLRKQCVFAVGTASAREIERMNVRNAAELAMLRAFARLAPLLPGNGEGALILVDGNHAPNFGVACETAVKGDATHACIAAASIIAKTARDAYMRMAATAYPHYGWEKNAGYSVKAHKEALARRGPSPFHRATYAPVAAAIKGQAT
ncbi:MAG: ribonuclease HII [Rickettsiales bacterium]